MTRGADGDVLKSTVVPGLYIYGLRASASPFSGSATQFTISSFGVGRREASSVVLFCSSGAHNEQDQTGTLTCGGID